MMMAKADMDVQDLLDARENARWPVRLVAGIVFLNGVFAILDVLYSRLSPRLESLLPIDYEYFGRFFGLFAGFLLIYFSSRLLRRKLVAWWMAFGGSVLIVVDHSLLARDVSALMLPGLSLVLLAVYRNDFKARSEPSTVKQSLKLLALSVGIALTYGTIGFVKLLPHDVVPAHNFSLAEGAVRTVREFTLIGNDDLSLRTRQARWFLDSLDVFGVAGIGFAFLGLFRPLSYRYRTLPMERARASRVLEEYGNSSEDAFKLWPEDKSYFFAESGHAFVSFRVARGVAVVLGEPTGPVGEWRQLLSQFVEYCRIHDWVVSFVYVPEKNVPELERAGWRAMKIGEDAIVDTAHFVREVAGNKHFRAVRNKFGRLGYRFEIDEPPHGQVALNATAHVSRAWLGSGGRTERGFGLGYYDQSYLQGNRLYLVYDAQDKLVAFASGIHSYNVRQETVDLMRYLPGDETGVMDFMFYNIIHELQAHGVAEFSLGLVPLAGVAENGGTLEEKVVAGLSPLLMGGFSYEGLRRFKDKFEPRWEGRFALYERGAIGLATTAVALNEVMRRR